MTPAEQMRKAEQDLLSMNVRVAITEKQWRDLAEANNRIVTKDVAKARDTWWQALDNRTEASLVITKLKKLHGTIAYEQANSIKVIS